jgi:hypothetical protein
MLSEITVNCTVSGFCKKKNRDITFSGFCKKNRDILVNMFKSDILYRTVFMTGYHISCIWLPFYIQLSWIGGLFLLRFHCRLFNNHLVCLKVQRFTYLAKNIVDVSLAKYGIWCAIHHSFTDEYIFQELRKMMVSAHSFTKDLRYLSVSV